MATTGRDPSYWRETELKNEGIKRVFSIQNIWALFSRIRFLGLERFLSFLVKIKIVSIYKKKKSFKIRVGLKSKHAKRKSGETFVV